MFRAKLDDDHKILYEEVSLQGLSRCIAHLQMAHDSMKTAHTALMHKLEFPSATSTMPMTTMDMEEQDAVSKTYIDWEIACIEYIQRDGTEEHAKTIFAIDAVDIDQVGFISSDYMFPDARTLWDKHMASLSLSLSSSSVSSSSSSQQEHLILVECGRQIINVVEGRTTVRWSHTISIVANHISVIDCEAQKETIYPLRLYRLRVSSAASHERCCWMQVTDCAGHHLMCQMPVHMDCWPQLNVLMSVYANVVAVSGPIHVATAEAAQEHVRNIMAQMGAQIQQYQRHRVQQQQKRVSQPDLRVALKIVYAFYDTLRVPNRQYDAPAGVPFSVCGMALSTPVGQCAFLDSDPRRAVLRGMRKLDREQDLVMRYSLGRAVSESKSWEREMLAQLRVDGADRQAAMSEVSRYQRFYALCCIMGSPLAIFRSGLSCSFYTSKNATLKKLFTYAAQRIRGTPDERHGVNAYFANFGASASNHAQIPAMVCEAMKLPH